MAGTENKLCNLLLRNKISSRVLSAIASFNEVGLFSAIGFVCFLVNKIVKLARLL